MIDLFANLAALQRCLDYHLQRHAVLSSNVANAETPGFRPLDVSFDAYLARASDLRVTDPRHMGPGAGDQFRSALFEDATAAVGNDGNAVSMEREMSKISANSIRYRGAAEMITRRLGLLKYAATDGQRR